MTPQELLLQIQGLSPQGGMPAFPQGMPFPAALQPGQGVAPPPTNPYGAGGNPMYAPQPQMMPPSMPAELGQELKPVYDYMTQPIENFRQEHPSSPFRADMNALIDAPQNVKHFMEGNSPTLDWLNYKGNEALNPISQYFTGQDSKGFQDAEQKYLAGDQNADPPQDKSFWEQLGALDPGARQHSGGMGYSGSEYHIPLGDAYPDLGPPPERKVAPELDYGPMMDTFGKAAPKPHMPDKWGSVLSSLSQGDMGAHADNIGEWALSVGQGIAGAAGDYRGREQNAQEIYDSQQAAYNAKLAELELSKSEVHNQHEQSVLDAGYANESSAREEAFRKFEASKPQVLSASGGVLAYTTTGPDGKQMFTMDTRPAASMVMARTAARGLGGAGSAGEDFPYGSDDPMDYATWAASALESEPGLAQILLPDDYEPLAMEALQEAQTLDPSAGKDTNTKALQIRIAKLAKLFTEQPELLQQVLMSQMGGK